MGNTIGPNGFSNRLQPARLIVEAAQVVLHEGDEPDAHARRIPRPVAQPTTIKSRCGRRNSRVVRAAGSSVLRDERVLAQRPRARDGARLIAPHGGQRVRRLAVLDPRHQCVEHAGGLRAGAAGAVRDAGREKEARELRRLLRAAHPLLHALVVVDGALGGDELIGPAVPDDRLAAAIAECAEVRIVGADDDAVLLVGAIPERLIRRRRDRRPVELRILREEIPQPVDGEPKRLRRERRAPARGQRVQIGAARAVRTRAGRRPRASGPPTACG